VQRPPRIGFMAPLKECFNPHPSRRTGATVRTQWAVVELDVSILTRPEGRVQPGGDCVQFTTSFAFQSSPVPKDGCNDHGIATEPPELAVSILTRPEGRVQRDCSG